jgi:hypothetical protein
VPAVTATEAPATAATTPEAATKAPATAATTPEAATKAPGTAATTPEAATKAPEAATKAGEAATQVPRAATQAPKAATQVPQAEAGAKAPEASVMAPSRAAERPAPATRTPATRTAATGVADRRAGAGPYGEVCPVGPSASWGFDAGVAEAVPLCRRTARAILAAAWGLEAREGLVDDALLIISELVSNVFRHVDSPEAAVALTLSEESLSICVYDRSPVLPRTPPEPMQGSTGWDWTGFGLAMVEATAGRYGGTVSIMRDPNGRGKSVGVDLPMKTAG